MYIHIEDMWKVALTTCAEGEGETGRIALKPPQLVFVFGCYCHAGCDLLHEL